METTVVFVDPYEEADEEVCWILFVVFVFSFTSLSRLFQL